MLANLGPDGGDGEDCPPGEGRGLRGGPGGIGPLADVRDVPPPPHERVPAFVLYVATGDETGSGKVYQVDEHGRVLGWVTTPFTPTGMALHRTHGLVLALPRDGGRIMRIDETGKLTTLLEKEKSLVHPIDVAIAGDSDTVIVADNIADVLAATSTETVTPKIYERFKGQKWTAQRMSVAVTKDKHVIFGTDGEEGIYRFSGDDHSASQPPLLPSHGGVAADPKSLRWAAAQAPNQIYLFEGEELERKLRLPPNKGLYRSGLLSFSPAGSLCVLSRDGDDPDAGHPWFLMYDLDSDDVRTLFPWKHETITDFVVGPRMPWDRKSPGTYRSIY